MLLSNPLREGALALVRTLRAHGHEAVWAGGCVRDMVLGLTPKDYDIATAAKPEEVLEIFPKAIPVGIQFGVVRVLHLGHMYEIATFRADGDYEDGRRPTGVRWASAREDVLRRDFTMNGLLHDPVAEETIDFVGGRDDIAARLIRAIGDPEARFGEDHLRVLRALRFAARFGFTIEDGTWAQVTAFAERVVSVSVERIREELERLLTEGGAARGLGLLVDSGVGGALLPGIDLTIPARHFRGLGACEPEVGWGLLFAHTPSEAVTARMEALRHSRQRARLVGDVVEVAQALRAYRQLGLAGRKRLLRREGAAAALTVAAAEGVDVSEARRDLAGFGEDGLRPAPLLGGKDLSAAGHRPGPAFKAALEAVETAQLEGRIATRDEAMALAEAVLREA